VVAPFGSGGRAASQDVILSAASFTVRLPLWRGGDATRRPKEAAWAGTWATGEGLQQDVPRRVQQFDRGAGFAHRSVYTDNATEWDGFAESENVCTRFGSVVLAGEQTPVGVPAGWGPLVKLIGYRHDLFVICETTIGYLPGGTGALSALYSLAGDTFTDAELWQGSLRVANGCSHTGGAGAGFHHSFVTITSLTTGAPYTVTQPDQTGTGGVPHLFRLLQTVFWEHEGWRGTAWSARPRSRRSAT
jgi:hypothetical protein